MLRSRNERLRLGVLPLSALLIATTGCFGGAADRGAPTGAFTGTATFTLTFEGRVRNYELHVPATLNGAPAPLLIQLHGGGGNGQRINGLTRFAELGDRQGFVTVAPSGVDKGWNDGRSDLATTAVDEQVDDVGFIAAVIDQVASVFPIDRTRVYAVGISNGAMMTGRLACELSDRLAGVAMVAGTAAADAASWCHPSRPVPMLQIHGTEDPIVPYRGGTVKALGTQRGKVLGVDALAELWRSLDGATSAPTSTTMGPDVTVRGWGGPTPQSDLVFYRVEGAGHTWPGGMQYLPQFVIGSTTNTFDATTTIWQFLSTHRLNTG